MGSLLFLFVVECCLLFEYVCVSGEYLFCYGKVLLLYDVVW